MKWIVIILLYFFPLCSYANDDLFGNVSLNGSALSLSEDSGQSPSRSVILFSGSFKGGVRIVDNIEMSLRTEWGLSDGIMISSFSQENLFTLDTDYSETIKVGFGFNYFIMETPQQYTFRQLLGGEFILKYGPSNNLLFSYSVGPVVNSGNFSVSNVFHHLRAYWKPVNLFGSPEADLESDNESAVEAEPASEAGVNLAQQEAITKKKKKKKGKRPFWVTGEISSLNFLSVTGDTTRYNVISVGILYGFP